MCPVAREVNMVKTKYGMVEGFRKDGCRVYLGIPFAKPPVGPLMFRHPAEPEPWEGVLKADRGGRNPVQVQGAFSRGNNSLDCLYLNVFVPEEDADTARPVMVWVYGGAYSRGGAGAPKEGNTEIAYDFCRFARETRTVVVTFNYRLNLYGFLNLACLSRRFDRNNGLFDQIQALKFVRENIAAFGGDAGNVTVFGQSAGGACILALMSMPETEGLFHKAIVQSACIDHFFTEEESRARTKLYLKHMRIRHLSELFEVSAERVMAVNRSFAPGDVMIMTDHIKLTGDSPLRGKNIEEFGPRFFDASHIYTPAFRPLARRCIEESGLTAREGVYMFFTGPQFETPAEIRAARVLGADAVGMSTVTEALTAAHCGLPVLGLSVMTNMAAGVLEQPLSAEEVNETASRIEERFSRCMASIVEQIGEVGE